MIGLENKTLYSERLSYRLLAPSDKAALREILSKRSVTEPAGFLPAATAEEFDRFFAGLTRYNTGIAILRDDMLIGYIHVSRYVPDLPEYHGKNCISLGFLIGEKYQNRGYATETLKTVTAYLKKTFDFCIAEHFTGNEPSKRVIEKCGYRYTETYTLFFEELGRDMISHSYVY